MKKANVYDLTAMLSLICFLFPPPQTSAATYYVNCNLSSASDTNPGTIDSPWSTIHYAAETLGAGDSVLIRAGTYNEFVYIDNAGNPTDGHIVFSAYPGETVIIDGTGVTDTENGIVVDKAYIKLLGLQVRNWNGNGIWIENAPFLEISDCMVHDVFYGIGVADGTHDFVFNRVEVHHFDLYGFDVSPSGGADCCNGTFNDCVSHTGRDPQQNVDGFALGHGTQHDFVFNRCKTYDVYDGFDISSRNTVMNACLAYNCINGCYKLWQDNVRLENCIGCNAQISIVELDWDGEPGAVSLMNCTFYNSQTFTIWVENASDTLKMNNCILAGGDNIALAFEQRDAKNYVGNYNLFHNDNPNRAIVVGYEDEFSMNQLESGDWTAYSGQDAHSLVSNTDADLFVDPMNLDFHLSQTSIAIDQGTLVDAPSVDYDGSPRPQGKGVDIGAFEYQGATGIRDGGTLLTNPGSMRLFQNYPNPFNPETTITYDLIRNGYVELTIVDLLGRRIRTLLDEEKGAGRYQVTWNGLDDHGNQVASGIYLCIFKIEEYTETINLLLIH